MEGLPRDLQAFLLNHPFLQLTDGKKIKCTLNGHEFPCNLAEVQKFTNGKKYKALSAASEFKYSQYEPHIVPSTKQPNQLFCKLTVKHINRQPHHVLKHVNGQRFKKALGKYEECLRQGIVFVPARLQQQKPRDSGGEVKGVGKKKKQQGGALWEPASGDEGSCDSEDSMSDLYPPQLFSVTNSMEEDLNGHEEDDFQTDDDEEMEVDEQIQKRKKVKVEEVSFPRRLLVHDIVRGTALLLPPPLLVVMKNDGYHYSTCDWSAVEKAVAVQGGGLQKKFKCKKEKLQNGN